MMQQRNVHHIPVMSGSHLTGIVSQHDLLQAQLRLEDEFLKTPLEQICSTDTLIVSPVDPIDEVVRSMLQRSKDSAAVVDGGFVVGVFTTTDALRFVGDFFGQE